MNRATTYRAFLHNDDTRVFVSFLLLFLLPVDAVKLSLRKTQMLVSGFRYTTETETRAGARNPTYIG